MARDRDLHIQARPKRPEVTPWLAALLALAMLLGLGLGVAPPAFLVAARSLMFSNFLPDDVINEARLNQLLGAQAVAVTDIERYRHLIQPRAYEELSHFAEQHAGNDTGLAREILLRMSPGEPTGGCGAESLREKIALVAARRGCCSDFTAAFQVYARALGLAVRRVETQSHTTNEYFDRIGGNWVWIDTMYRTQATDDDGRLLSFYQLREHLLAHRPIRILTLSDTTIAPLTSHVLFDASNFSVAYWYPPADLVAEDDFDGEWRRFHVVRPVRQLVGYLAGVRAEPTGLASPSMAYRLRIASRIAWISLILLATSELLFAVVVVARSLKGKGGRELPEKRPARAVVMRLDGSEESD